MERLCLEMPAVTARTTHLKQKPEPGRRTAGEVAVHDAACVQERHAGRHLARGRQHGRHAQPALQLAALRAEPALVDRLLRGPRRARSRRRPQTCRLAARHVLEPLTRHVINAALPCSTSVKPSSEHSDGCMARKARLQAPFVAVLQQQPRLAVQAARVHGPRRALRSCIAVRRPAGCRCVGP